MGYFGGLGAGKGWMKFLFLVDPDVLREALIAAKPVLVVTNARVPVEYESTPLENYIAGYSRYVEAMLESSKAAQEAAMGTHIGLAASLDRFSATSCPDSRYKLMNSEEPVVTIGPLTLYFDARRGQLCTNVFSNLHFGVELGFPRVISLDRDNHQLLYETREFQTFGIFEAVRTSLQKATTPCRIRSPSREHRTPIRITMDLKERMRRHPGLIAASLELV